jgi:hypothetical protein
MLRRSFLRHTPFVVLAAAAPALAGCASGPKYAEVASRIPAVPPGRSRVWFFRDGSPIGSGIQPSVMVNGQKVGDSVPGGFFYTDVTPGNHEVLLSTEVDRKLTFTTAPGEERWVRMTVTLGALIYRVYPELVPPETGRAEIQTLAYTGQL